MATSLKLRKEEYTTLGDFIRVSFERDLPAITGRYPKLNEAYKNQFIAKLEEVKTLESGLTLTEEQKNATQSLYQEVDVVNKELNFLNSYCKDAGIGTEAVTDLKKALAKGNVEGTILKIESLKQFVMANTAALIEEGMATDFATTLEAHKTSLATKNTLQNSTMNARKTLTSNNKEKYNDLYAYITKIMRSGKLVFSNSIVKDEYTISKVISRMRANN
jgi:hypothetical protein